MPRPKDLIGLNIAAIKGEVERLDRRKSLKYVYTKYILLSDEKTIIELENQDYIDFHDCDMDAKVINTIQDPKLWKTLMENSDGYHPDATTLHPMD